MVVKDSYARIMGLMPECQALEEYTAMASTAAANNFEITEERLPNEAPYPAAPSFDLKAVIENLLSNTQNNDANPMDSK